MNPYESDSLLREYLLFHFGSAAEIFADLPGPADALDFAKRCVVEMLDVNIVGGSARALDVGCAVGGSCFELARYCDRVLGIDYSKGFIEAAKTLASVGSMDSSRLIEAGRFESFVATVPADIDRSKIHFQTGDATALDASLQNFDVVLAANLICRLLRPMAFLERLPGLVKPGGQLLLATPLTWLEDYTPRDLWLGRERSGFDDLKAILSPNFELAHTTNLPFVIREHARKFQYGISLGSRWIRKRVFC